MRVNSQLLKGLMDKVILKIINEEETYGYEIYIKLQKLGFIDFAEGSLYPLLLRLEKKGLIKRDPTKPRALEIVELNSTKREMLNIPIVGKVTAGLPILATENIEDTFSLPLDFIKHDRELFMLKVTGDSMINAGIREGDLAIIEQTNAALNGEIVVALIENEATIKRFFKEKDSIRLQPENDAMAPIIVDDCSILGKLVGLFRQY